MPIAPADQELLDAAPPGPAAPVPAPVVGPPVPIGIAPAPAAVVAPPVAAPAASDVALPAPIGTSAPAAVPAQAAAPIPTELQGIKNASDARVTAAQEIGAAKKEQDDQVAATERDSRVQNEADAAEVAEMRADHARAARVAEDRTQQALVAARDAKIPDFWAGREGARTSAALAVGLGGYAAGLLGESSNGALDIINGNVDHYYSREKDKIDNLYKFAAGQSKAQEDTRLQQAADLAELQVQHGATKLAIADHIKEITAATQGRIDVGEANAMMSKLVQEGEQSILAGRETLARINLQSAQAVKAARWHAPGTGGGGGGVDALTAFTDAAGKLNAGDPIPAEVVALGVKAGIKKDKIADQVDKYRGSAAKSEKNTAQADKAAGKAPPGADPGLAIRDGSGRTIGYLPKEAARSFDKVSKEFPKLQTAIDSIEELKRADLTIPRGPEWDRAVLAIAATSNAGTTIPALQHEAASLKGFLGNVSKEAIDMKLAELTKKYNAYKNQLIPAGAGGSSRDDAKVGRAKAVANLATATAAQKANATAYLRSVGESP